MSFLFAFRGRIGRGMWWLCQAVGVVVLLATILLMERVYPGELMHAAMASLVGGVLKGWTVLSSGASLLLALGIGLSTWINIASTVKRLHDRDKSGLWSLIAFVPYIAVVGSPWILTQCGFLAGTPGPNDYGPPGSAGLPESESSSFDPEATIQAYLRERERSQRPAYSAATSPPAAGAGYREETPVARARPPAPAVTFGRRNA